MGSQQEFCLKWNNHQSNMLSVFDHLLATESFVDVTLATGDGFLLKAHKVLLSACSPYFRRLLEDNPCQHPIVILADVRHDEMRAIVDFMYKGEVNVTEERLSNLLKTAETLKIKGLAEVPSSPPASPQPPQSQPQPSVRHQFSASSYKGVMPRPRQSLSSSRRKRKSNVMKLAATSSSSTSSSSSSSSQFGHGVPQPEHELQELQQRRRLQPMDEASAGGVPSATPAKDAVAQPPLPPPATNESDDAAFNPLSLDIVKVESIAPVAADRNDDNVDVDMDMTAVTAPDDYPVDSMLPAQLPPPSTQPPTTTSLCPQSMNRQSGDKVDESGQFVEDPANGEQSVIASSGGPSTSTGSVSSPPFPPLPSSQRRPPCLIKKRALIWDYFNETNDPSKAECKLCFKWLSRGGVGKSASTSGMRNHLRIHPDEHARFLQRWPANRPWSQATERIPRNVS